MWYQLKIHYEKALFWSFFRVDQTGKNIPIEKCSDAKQSALTTWQDFIFNSGHIKKIGIIGHSYGGVVTMKLAEKFRDDFKQKVFAVLFTDSVHGGMNNLPNNLAEKCINFVASDKPLGQHLGTNQKVLIKSAGHTIHEWTPSTSRKCLFEYFDQFSHE